jgi:hypothetical protein
MCAGTHFRISEIHPDRTARKGGATFNIVTGPSPGAAANKRLEVGLLVVVVVVVAIAVMIPIAPLATLADFFELAAPLLGLAAALAVLADGFLQILFRLADVMAALVITVGAGGRRHSGQ